MPPTLLSRAEQCFRSLIPHQQSQLRTGCSQIAANPETGRTHVSAYAFKKRSSSKLLSNFSLVTGENSNVLPGNMAWGEMLRSHVPCAPHELCRWHQGEDEPRELHGTPPSTPGCPPASRLPFVPGWCQVKKRGLEIQIESSCFPPYSAGACSTYTQTDTDGGLLQGRWGLQVRLHKGLTWCSPFPSSPCKPPSSFTVSLNLTVL